jgi:hypothetical protein
MRPDGQGRALNTPTAGVVTRNLYIASGTKIVRLALGKGCVGGDEHCQSTIHHARSSSAGEPNHMQSDGRDSSTESCEVRDNAGCDLSAAGRRRASDHYGIAPTEWARAIDPRLLIKTEGAPAVIVLNHDAAVIH